MRVWRVEGWGPAAGCGGDMLPGGKDMRSGVPWFTNFRSVVIKLRLLVPHGTYRSLEHRY